MNSPAERAAAAYKAAYTIRRAIMAQCTLLTAYYDPGSPEAHHATEAQRIAFGLSGDARHSADVANDNRNPINREAAASKAAAIVRELQSIAAVNDKMIRWALDNEMNKIAAAAADTDESIYHKKTYPAAPLLKPEAITMIRRLDPDQFADYWTICTDNMIISSSDNPTHPMGVWGCNDVDDWAKWDNHSGDLVQWEALPAPLQRHLVWYFSPEETTTQ